MSHMTETREEQRCTVRLGDRGRLVLPAPIRESMGLREGDRLILTVEPDGSLRLRSLRDQIRKMRGIYAHIEPDACWSEELLRERREEARREEAE